MISLLQTVKVNDIYHEIVKTILHNKTGFLQKGYLSYEDQLLSIFILSRQHTISYVKHEGIAGILGHSG